MQGVFGFSTVCNAGHLLHTPPEGCQAQHGLTRPAGCCRLETKLLLGHPPCL